MKPNSNIRNSARKMLSALRIPAICIAAVMALASCQKIDEGVEDKVGPRDVTIEMETRADDISAILYDSRFIFIVQDAYGVEQRLAYWRSEDKWKQIEESTINDVIPIITKRFTITLDKNVDSPAVGWGVLNTIDGPVHASFAVDKLETEFIGESVKAKVKFQPAGAILAVNILGAYGETDPTEIPAFNVWAPNAQMPGEWSELEAYNAGYEAPHILPDQDSIVPSWISKDMTMQKIFNSQMIAPQTLNDGDTLLRMQGRIYAEGKFHPIYGTTRFEAMVPPSGYTFEAGKRYLFTVRLTGSTNLEIMSLQVTDFEMAENINLRSYRGIASEDDLRELATDWNTLIPNNFLTEKDLEDARKLVISKWSEDKTATGEIKLLSDITMDPANPFPGISIITDENTSGVVLPFDAAFNGNGCTIDGLTIDVSSTYNGQNAGLFGTIKNGAVHDLKLKNVSITASNDEMVNGIGAIAGQVIDSEIISCLVDGTIAGNDKASYAGGLVGYAESCIIDGCRFDGSILGMGDATTGGMIGYAISPTILGCAVALTRSDDSGQHGGIIGTVEGGSIGACSASLTVTGQAGNGEFSGIAGVLKQSTQPGVGNIFCCYAFSTDEMSGGVIGELEGEILDTIQYNMWFSDAQYAIQSEGDYPEDNNILIENASQFTPALRLPINEQIVEYNDAATKAGTRVCEFLWYIATGNPPFIMAEVPPVKPEVEKERFIEWLNNPNILETSFKLRASFDISDIEWVPIGTEEAPYMGTFNGDGYTLGGSLRFEATYGTEEVGNPAGFFGVVGAGGKVNGLNLENVEIITNKDHVGGIVGKTYGDITNCSIENLTVTGNCFVGGIAGQMLDVVNLSTCDVINATISGVTQVGGIVGRSVHQNDNNMSGHNIVEKCTFEGTVTGSGTAGDVQIGGIVGHNQTFSPSYGNSIVRDCSAKASVSGAGNATGGIVGDNHNAGSLVLRCTFEGRVEGTKTNVGGIAGNNRVAGALVDDCHVVNSEIYGLGVLGGVVGFNNNKAILRNSTFTNGKVLATGETNRVGGIAGLNGGSSTTNCHVDGLYVYGINEVGGIVGANAINAVVNPVNEITGCTINNGTVESFATTSQNANVGGIVGMSNYKNGVFDDCHATNMTILGNGPNVGGIVGENRGGTKTTNCTIADATVTNVNIDAPDRCQNTGGIAGDIYDGGANNLVDNCTATRVVVYGAGIYTGGIAGRVRQNTNTLINCTATEGSVEGAAEWVGGVVGWTNALEGTSKGVQNCHWEGPIKGTKSVGGIAGQAGSPAAFKNCTTEGTIEGTEQVGGIFGMCTNDGNSSAELCYSIMTSFTYTTGNALIGMGTGKATNCFWYTAGTGVPAATGGTAANISGCVGFDTEAAVRAAWSAAGGTKDRVVY